MKPAVRLVSLALLGLLLVLVASRGRLVTRQDSPEVAVVGGDAITMADLERRISGLPEATRANLQEPERQLGLLEHMVNEMALVKAAESVGLDRNPEFKAILADARRQLISNYYREQVLRERARPDSAYVRTYYAEHPEEFRIAERVTGRQIVTATESDAEEVRRELLAGTPVASLIDRSIDEATRSLGGAIGIVTRGAPVRGVGHDEALVEALLELGPGDVSPPLKTDLGYHVVSIESHDEERVRSIESVWESLARRLHPVRFRQVYETAVDSLRQAYRATIHQEVLYGAERYRIERAKEFFEAAQSASDPRERLNIYQEILDLDTEVRYAAQARFMRGFVYLEELDDEEQGRRELERVLRDYPDSDLVDSARWMLENDRTQDTMPPDSTPDSTSDSTRVAPATGAASGGDSQ